MDCIFHDAQEDRIEACIPKNLVRAWRDRLLEGEIYGLTNLKVATDNRSYKMTACAYRLFFTEKTQALRLMGKDFPDGCFCFKNFEEIHQMQRGRDAPAFDVMGSILRMDEPEFIAMESGEKKLLNLVLEDTGKRTLSCTLWGEYVDQLLALVETEASYPKILIIQLCKQSSFKDEKKVSNIYHATKLLLNAPFPQVEDFRERMLACSSMETTKCSSVSQGSTKELSEGRDGVSKMKTIEQLLIADGDAYCWIVGVVDRVDYGDGWSYLACEKCRKKLSKVDTQFYCQKCNNYSASTNLRYKVKLHVRDDTGFIELLLWDNECFEIIGKSAVNLEQDSQISSTGLHEVIEQSFLERKFSFKINQRSGAGNPFGGGYTVTRIERQHTIAPTYSESQESNSLAKVDSFVHLDTPSSKLQTILVSTSDVHTMQNDLLHVDQGTLPHVDSASPSAPVLSDLSSAADVNPRTLTKGPVKRCLDTDLSTAQLVQKPKMRVKKEKK